MPGPGWCYFMREGDSKCLLFLSHQSRFFILVFPFASARTFLDLVRVFTCCFPRTFGLALCCTAAALDGDLVGHRVI